MITVAFVANHLGAVAGGVNVFNAEIINTLKSYEGLRTVCIVPSPSCVDSSFSRLTHVISLRSSGKDFLTPTDDALLAEAKLKDFGKIDAVIGHDVFSGELALEIGNRVGAKKILIHHMAYGRYISLMREPEIAKAKEVKQRKLFPCADLTFAVGPLLLDNLLDIQRLSGDMPTPRLLLPPFLDITPAKSPRSVARILYSGRIENGNDPVKQGVLAAKSIGRALRLLPRTVHDTTVDFYGFEADSSLVKEFRDVIEEEAGFRVPLKCLEFVDSRAEMLDVVKDSSLLIMPSVHEGFGLVAWEAMCCGVPVIVSRNSGFYRYIESLGLAVHVDAVTVSDHNAKAAQDQQVDELANLIRSRIQSPMDSHLRAEKLLKAVQDKGGVKETIDDLLHECGYFAGNFGNQKKSEPILCQVSDSLSEELTVEVDVGVDGQDRVEYSCITSTRRIQTALLAYCNGVSGAGVKVTSSYLKRLTEIAELDPDADRRVEAAVRYRIDLPKIEKLEAFLSQAFIVLASSDFADIGFPTEYDRAVTFSRLIDELNYRISRENHTYIDAVQFDPYKTFSIWIPTETLEKKDFYHQLFTVNDGATLGDIWFDCCSEVSAAYLRGCMSLSMVDGVSPPPLGQLLKWRIGSH